MHRKTQGGGKLSGGLGGDGGGLFPVSSFSLVSFGSLPAGTDSRLAEVSVQLPFEFSTV